VMGTLAGFALGSAILLAAVLAPTDPVLAADVQVGAPLEGRALVIDDVITAGTAIREVAELFERTEASIAGVFVAVDRQERGRGELSAIQEVQESLGVPVRSIVSMSDIIVWLEEQEGRDADRVALKQYRKRYGVEG